MEELFSTNIEVNGRDISYRVVFENEKYNFISDEGGQSYSSFSFRRQHDEWVDEASLPPQINKQAIDALENYLLQQH